jgi:hypothetical protein
MNEGYRMRSKEIIQLRTMGIVFGLMLGRATVARLLDR